ncbi:MAG: redox-sensing transcriptional repressor Rex [Lentimicrobiaceae bacterium]|nr:redox-sensing transcriptional repressor Rex [Lentimicrobiaceae bacterium]
MKKQKKYRKISVPKETLLRLPKYYEYLKAISKEGAQTISSTKIAKDMRLNSVLVRKDLAMISSVPGKPRVGFRLKDLMMDIEDFLGYNNLSDAVLVGVGSLGKALLSYEGFKEYGLKIAMAFDIDGEIVGKKINDINIFHINRLDYLTKRLNVKMGIIATPKQVAQSVCDNMVDAGIIAIWNFAPIHLTVPDGIVVKDENLAASLALLRKKLPK